jgi:hypothetical protein
LQLPENKEKVALGNPLFIGGKPSKYIGFVIIKFKPTNETAYLQHPILG